jgi:O-antigen ligase
MNQQSQVAPRLAGGAVALPASSYWAYIVPIALMMTAVIGARAHEGVPIVSKLRPALILGLFGGLFAWFGTSQTVRLRALENPVFRGVAMYMAWATVTVPFALWRGGAFAAIRAYLPAMVLTFVLLLCPPTRETFDKLQRGFVLGCFGTACSALLFGYVSDEGRLTTSGSLDANDLAAVMAMSAPLAMGLISREKSWLRKMLWIGASAVQLLVLVKSGSRGALIALVIGTIFFVIGQKGSRRFIFLVLCVLAGIAAWSGASDNFKRRISELLSGTQDYNYTEYTGRKAVWARARVYIMDHPLLGVGVGNFPFAEGETCRKNFPDRGCKWSTTHNSWLQSGAELGIPGMILFILMLLRGARVAWKLWVPRSAPEGMHVPELFAALIGFATAATFLSHAYFPLMFALLGVIGLAGLTAEQTALAPARAALPNASPDAARGLLPRPFSRPAHRPLQPLRPVGPLHPVRTPMPRPVPQGLVRAARPLLTRRTGRPRP